MNKKAIFAIVKKDLKTLSQSPKTWIPMVIICVLLCIILPSSLSYTGTHTEVFSLRQYQHLESIVDDMISDLPDGSLKEGLQKLDDTGMQFTYFIVNFVLITLFLMVTIINSMVSATSSFVSEKERGTLETLLFSPVTVKELLVAKVISSFIPTIVIIYSTYIVSFISLNSINYSKFGYFMLLDVQWFVLMIWLTPLVVLFNVLLNVYVSAKVKTYQEAQQIGGLLIIPMIVLVAAQATGVFFVSSNLLFISGVFMLVLNFIMGAILFKYNNRNSLFERQIH